MATKTTRTKTVKPPTRAQSDQVESVRDRWARLGEAKVPALVGLLRATADLASEIEDDEPGDLNTELFAVVNALTVFADVLASHGYSPVAPGGAGRTVADRLEVLASHVRAADRKEVARG